MPERMDLFLPAFISYVAILLYEACRLLAFCIEPTHVSLWWLPAIALCLAVIVVYTTLTVALMNVFIHDLTRPKFASA